MRQSIIAATLLAAVAWAAPAPAADGTTGLAERRGGLVARSNYVECHQNCVRGCPGGWICQAACNAACANAGEADDHEAAAIAAREAVAAATKSVAVREERRGSLVARSNYVECHQNCVRGCPGGWICQAACNAACANAGETDQEVAAVAAPDA
ncbi:hypothetical protein V8F33_011380 [Rhypophila sp. PSN 637]